MSLLDKAKAAAEKAAEKAKQGVEAGKDMAHDLKIKRQIDDLQGEIGALVVAKRRGDAPDDADAQVDAKVDEVLALAAQLEASEAEAGGDGAVSP
jgi:hypothetical protein